MVNGALLFIIANYFSLFLSVYSTIYEILDFPTRNSSQARCQYGFLLYAKKYEITCKKLNNIKDLTEAFTYIYEKLNKAGLTEKQNDNNVFGGFKVTIVESEKLFEPTTKEMIIFPELRVIKSSKVTTPSRIKHPIKFLNLSSNGLEELNNKFFVYYQDGIQELDLSRNKFTTINDAQISTLSPLVSLDLSNNAIQAIFFDAFKNLKHLTKLFLRGNNFAYLSDLGEGLPSAPKNYFPALEILDLSDCQLSYNTFDSLRALPPKLKVLLLDNNPFYWIQPKLIALVQERDKIGKVQLSLMGSSLVCSCKNSPIILYYVQSSENMTFDDKRALTDSFICTWPVSLNQQSAIQIAIQNNDIFCAPTSPSFANQEPRLPNGVFDSKACPVGPPCDCWDLEAINVKSYLWHITCIEFEYDTIIKELDNSKFKLEPNTTLTLQNVMLPQIPTNFLQGYTMLQKLTIKDSGLKEIRENFLLNFATSLSFLAIEGNYIEKLLGNAFSKALILTTLSLGSNRIKLIDKDCFSGVNLPKLNNLDLTNNQIHVISFNLPDTLQTLTLSQNPLVTFSKDVLPSLAKNKTSLLKFLLLTIMIDSVIACDCSILSMASSPLLYEFKSPYGDEVSCVKPKTSEELKALTSPEKFRVESLKGIYDKTEIRNIVNDISLNRLCNVTPNNKLTTNANVPEKLNTNNKNNVSPTSNILPIKAQAINHKESNKKSGVNAVVGVIIFILLLACISFMVWHYRSPLKGYIQSKKQLLHQTKKQSKELYCPTCIITPSIISSKTDLKSKASISPKSTMVKTENNNSPIKNLNELFDYSGFMELEKSLNK